MHSFIADKYSCTGMLKCTDGSNCVPLAQRCDGDRQCQNGDDERFCGLTCPKGCRCNLLTYDCENVNATDISPDISPSARSLILNHNNLMLYRGQLDDFFDLVQLHLSRNDIGTLPDLVFAKLFNLLKLDLSYNNIESLNEKTFVGLRNLESLDLRGNPLSQIAENSFLDLEALPSLSLRDLGLGRLESGTFNGLVSLESLDITDNQMEELGPGIFKVLPKIEQLKMSGNKISQFDKADFTELPSLKYLVSDDYMFCCFVNIAEENCWPKPDEFSSCDDLMNNNILRIFLWVLGVMAFAGNGFVLAWRTVHHEGQKVPNFLLCNLSVADFLMGLYMLSVAFVDAYFRGNYIENAKWWKTSWLCSFLGCLSTVASEASVLTLSVITFDRLFNIVFPLSVKKLNMHSAKIVVGVVWVLSFLIGVIPLFPSEYFQVSTEMNSYIGHL